MKIRGFALFIAFLLSASVASAQMSTSTSTSTPPVPPPPPPIQPPPPPVPPPPVGDTTPPSAPPNVTLTENSGSFGTIQVGFYKSTDNVKVAGYYVYRNGAKIASVPSDPATDNYGWYFYYDTTTIGCASYAYYVVAYDAAGNISQPSKTVSLVTEIRQGAKVTTIASTPVYAGVCDKKASGTQATGAAGVVTGLLGGTPVCKGGKPAVYNPYSVNFSSGVNGYVERTNLQCSVVVADNQTPTLAISDMQSLLNNLETQIKAILAKIEDLKSALAAAASAAGSQ